MSKHPIVHFEMPYDDAARVNAFYSKAFGWNMQDTGPQMGNYVTAHTAETDANNMVLTPGAINGGFFPRKSDWPSQYPSVVVAVDDIHASMTAVRDAGGEVLGEPIDIPGIGFYVSFNDTEGNRVSMLQPHPRAV